LVWLCIMVSRFQPEMAAAGKDKSDPIVRTFSHYIHSFNQHDLTAVLQHLAPECKVSVIRQDGTSYDSTVGRDAMQKHYQRDFNVTKLTTTLHSVKRTHERDTSSGQATVRAMIHRSEGNWADVTYFIRENDLLMVQHLIHGFGKLDEQAKKDE